MGVSVFCYKAGYFVSSICGQQSAVPSTPRGLKGVHILSFENASSFG